MSESICRFIPKDQSRNDLQVIHFVYESEHHKLKQPFIRPFYYVFLVTEGNATLRLLEKEFPVTVGDIFFTFPGTQFEIIADGDIRYAYMSFVGSSVRAQYEALGIKQSEPVYKGYESLTEFWFSAISRVNEKNAVLISESVLLYTLSLVVSSNDSADKRQNDSTRFDMILNYVNENYRDPTLTLGKIADIFSYTEKYVSSLFKRHMEMGFNRYVNSRRINYALDLIDKGASSVRAVAIECGFSDALYFSKVFKKKTGITPTEMITKS